MIMEIDSEIAFRSIRKNGNNMLKDSPINTIHLVRQLDSDEVISPELYEEMTDKTKQWSNTDSLEHLLKQIRPLIQKDGALFASFVKALFDCGYDITAETLLKTYNTLAKEKKLSFYLKLNYDTGDVYCTPVSDDDSSETSSPTPVKRDSVSVKELPSSTVFESKGYEEFADVAKYGEPKLPDLLDWVIYKIPSKWYTVGLKLGFTEGILDGIKTDLSCGGDPKRMFQKVLTSWYSQSPSQYNWGVLLQTLASPSVGETRLANSVATHLKGEPYFGPEQAQFQDSIVKTNIQSDNVEAVYDILVKVIDSNYQRLNNAIDNSLATFARLLLEADIISRDVCTKAEYNSIMQSFTAGLSMKSTIFDLEKDCKSFVKALKVVGGPGRLAADRIMEQWREALQSKMGIVFNVEK